MLSSATQLCSRLTARKHIAHRHQSVKLDRLRRTSSAGSARSSRALTTRLAMSGNKGITLYTAGTPNGWKANIICEELGIDYKVHPISLSKNDQKQDWFLKINPNGRIPAIVDHDEGDLPVFESGAVLIYLAEKYNKFLPTAPRQKAEVISWLMWQMGGLGPMQGQANHFVRYAPEKIEYGIKRYTNETKRLYEVMERQLSDGREWLAAGQYTIADMAAFGWVYAHDWAGVPIDDLPNLKAWLKRIEERPAVSKAVDIPEESFVKAQQRDPKKKEELIEQSSKFVTK